ncbi:hypothetical protein [Parendozoicomonas haliclonae]|uniref:Uncharacterized protein n=1 Tax=Parendozoicomonas haliclonae TaxID=1960125 RepID=A0A1X7AEJ7_9GAMM|nr:hypothetical protein [Parendozoicomonas haliclonae]SMA33265.1 hypothetical protein EHSB41UT_00250 [Parendozoicomonas haliclonae]
MKILLMKVLTKMIAGFLAEKVLTEFMLMLGEKIVKSTKNTRDDEWFKHYEKAVRGDDKHSS